MEENLQKQQDQEAIQPQGQMVQSQGNQKNWVRIVLFVSVGVIVLIGTFYGGIKFSEIRQERVAEEIPTPSLEPSIFPGSTGSTPTTPTEKSPTPQEFTGETIQIKVRNPFYPDEIKAYLYEFTFDKKPGDTVKLIPAPYSGQDFYNGIEITRGAVKLSIQPAFEGVSITYDEIPEFEVITNWRIADNVIYRIKSKEPVNNYVYVSNYGEGEQGCSQWSPAPVACSMNNLSMKGGQGLGVSCTAGSENVAECDSIVRSLNIEITEL